MILHTYGCSWTEGEGADISVESTLSSTSSRSLTAAGLEERAHASPTHLRCRGGSLLVVTVDYLSYSIYCKL